MSEITLDFDVDNTPLWIRENEESGELKAEKAVFAFLSSTGREVYTIGVQVDGRTVSHPSLHLEDKEALQKYLEAKGLRKAVLKVDYDEEIRREMYDKGHTLESIHAPGNAVFGLCSECKSKTYHCDELGFETSVWINGDYLEARINRALACSEVKQIKLRCENGKQFFKYIEDVYGKV